MKYLPFLFILFACGAPSGQSIDNVIEESIKRREGVDIRIDPIAEEKHKA